VQVASFRRVWKTGKPERSARISFASPKLLWKVLTADITALLNAGVLDRASGGGVVFPYDAVKVEFLFRAR
jgi:hypothetical protein